MIVDTNADLNVYLDIGEDGQRKDGAQGPGGCCGPASPAAAGGCCGGGKASAASSAAQAGGGVPATSNISEDDKVDLNEFVGKSRITNKAA